MLEHVKYIFRPTSTATNTIKLRADSESNMCIKISGDLGSLPKICVYFVYVTARVIATRYAFDISNLDDLLYPPIAVHHQAELSTLPIRSVCGTIMGLKDSFAESLREEFVGGIICN